MVKITFYNYTGLPNQVTKTLSGGVEVEGLLYDVFNVVNPTIKIRQSGTLPSNYCFIPLLNRYYFIESVTVLGDDGFELELKVDVLQTYSTQIKNATGTVTRREGANKYISTRNGIYNTIPNMEKIDFPNTNLLDADGTKIMIAIKGNT